MKHRLIILFFLTIALVVVADRRAQLMSQRQPVASSGNPFAPPTISGPGIWLDVIEQVTNGVADNTVIPITTNWGFMGGWFTNYNNPNKVYRTLYGTPALTGIVGGGNSDSYRWVTNNDLVVGPQCNNQCYFQSNVGTVAIRVNNKDFIDHNAPIQTGTTGPTGPGPGYCYLQMLSGTVYFDYGQPGLTNRISKASPGDGNNQWINMVYIKSNDLMSIWINGTNWLQGTQNHQGEALFPTNNYAGPLQLMGGLLDTNYLCKRILCWRYALDSTEISALNTWMTAMP